MALRGTAAVLRCGVAAGVIRRGVGTVGVLLPVSGTLKAVALLPLRGCVAAGTSLMGIARGVISVRRVGTRC